MPRSQPMRSAMTVAGIVGVVRSSARTRSSTASATYGTGRRSWRGGDGERSAARTVLRDRPSSKAMALMALPSERCRRRISAQSATCSNPFRPGGRGRNLSTRMRHLGHGTTDSMASPWAG